MRNVRFASNVASVWAMLVAVASSALSLVTKRDQHAAHLPPAEKSEVRLEGDEERVKGVSRDLLGTLKRQQLVLDWRKRQQAHAQVRVAIEALLDRGLPPIYVLLLDRLDRGVGPILDRCTEKMLTS